MKNQLETMKPVFKAAVEVAAFAEAGFATAIAQMVVVKKPGGAGTIGLSAAANAKSDGHAVVLTTRSTIGLQPLYGRIPFRLESFGPVAKLFEIPAASNVHTHNDIKMVGDFVT